MIQINQHRSQENKVGFFPIFFEKKVSYKKRNYKMKSVMNDEFRQNHQKKLMAF